jgi:hypothetical protein
MVDLGGMDLAEIIWRFWPAGLAFGVIYPLWFSSLRCFNNRCRFGILFRLSPG